MPTDPAPPNSSKAPVDPSDHHASPTNSDSPNSPSVRSSKAGRGWSWTIAAIVFLSLAASGVAVDLWTKSYMFANYWPYSQPPDAWPNAHTPHWWIDGIFGIQTSTNGGALFGMMQGYQSVFVSLSVLALVGLLTWLFAFGAWRDRLLLCCLGLITGGILGNLYDRLGLWHDATTPVDFHYHVRDWIHFRLAGVPYFDPWPNFNIADSLLVVGVVLMLIHNLFFLEKQEE